MLHNSLPQQEAMSVGIVSWQALPAVFPTLDCNVGGLETAAWLTARSLVELNGAAVQVDFFYRSKSETLCNLVSGVRLHAHKNPREWVRRDVSKVLASIKSSGRLPLDLTFVWKCCYLLFTWPRRFRDLRHGDPDSRLISFLPNVWIAFGTSLEAAAVMETAASQRVPGILMIQSNNDLDEGPLKYPDQRSPYGELGRDCLNAIEKASVVICQTDLQKNLLHSRFNKSGVVLPNAIELNKWTVSVPEDKSQLATLDTRKRVLWIGRFDRFHKRPLLALEIAKACPELEFCFVANDSDESVKSEVIAHRPGNVEIIQYVPQNEMPLLMREFDVFLSTGSEEFEGFPNVFLQAAASRLPIVSLDDFGGFLEKSAAGFWCHGKVEEAIVATRLITSGRAIIDHDKVLEFLWSHHSHTAIAAKLVEILATAVNDESK